MGRGAGGWWALVHDASSVMIANASQRFNERGELTDETSRELIRKLLAELVAWTKRLGKG